MKKKSLGSKYVCFLFVIGLLSTPFLASQKSDSVDKLFSQWDKPDSPGVAIAVIQNGQIIYERGYGMANLEHEIRISGKTVFRIGSTSKQFTAACIALLALEGKLALDENIRKYLPEMPEYDKTVTIRHLLHHTSGIRDYLALSDIAGFSEFGFFTPEESYALVTRQKNLNFPPGEEHLYSNSGYLLLGVIVKRVSGQSLNEFAQARIFNPLGMESTQYLDDHTRIVKKRADGYSATEDGFRINNTTLDHVGDGGVFTTTEDLFLWDQAFFNFKLGKELMKLIQTPGSLNNGKALSYAFGLDVGEYRGLRRVSHGGAFVGFRADMVRFPEKRFSVICLANLGSIDPSRLCIQIANIYLDSDFAQPKESESAPKVSEIHLSLKALQEKAGNYQDERSGEWFVFSVKDDKLMVRLGRREYVFVPASPSRFMGKETPFPAELEFIADDSGHLTRVELQAAGEEFSLKKAAPLSALTASQLNAYVGEYHNEEFPVTFKLVVEKQSLRFVHKNAPEDSLESMAEDKFTAGRFNLEFVRNEHQAVIGLILGAGRAANIEFIKQ
ncbi:MAG: serine hydrolase [Candidatus Aminicenantes bacterium]|nr:serine hydrolase [Candidatus Aminicenantes bacterium]